MVGMKTDGKVTSRGGSTEVRESILNRNLRNRLTHGS